MQLSLDEFKSKQYFKVGDSESATKIAAAKLRGDFEALPERHRAGQNALVRALLGKLPSACSKQKESLEDKLIESEAMSRDAPWTYQTLTKIAAQYLLVAKRRVAAEVSAAEREAARSRQQHVPGRSGVPAGQQTSGGPNSKCAACGRSGHATKDCPTVCPAVVAESDRLPYERQFLLIAGFPTRYLYLQFVLLQHLVA